MGTENSEFLHLISVQTVLLVFISVQVNDYVRSLSRATIP